MYRSSDEAQSDFVLNRIDQSSIITSPPPLVVVVLLIPQGGRAEEEEEETKQKKNAELDWEGARTITRRQSLNTHFHPGVAVVVV